MNKKEIVEEIKEMLKEKGKAELMEFAEDMAELGWESVKIVVSKTENKIDDMVVASLDSMVKSYIDEIDGEEG